MRDAAAQLKLFKDSDERVSELWRQTTPLRLGYIHGERKSEPKPTLTQILENWPRYADSKGYQLVSTYELVT